MLLLTNYSCFSYYKRFSEILNYIKRELEKTFWRHLKFNKIVDIQ